MSDERPSCKRCLFQAITFDDLCLGHLAAAEGRRVIGVTTDAVKEPHLRGVRVVFIGYWRGAWNDIIAEMEDTIDTPEPQILNLGPFEVDWLEKTVG